MEKSILDDAMFAEYHKHYVFAALQYNKLSKLNSTLAGWASARAEYCLNQLANIVDDNNLDG